MLTIPKHEDGFAKSKVRESRMDIYPIELIRTGARIILGTTSKKDQRDPLRAMIVYQLVDIEDSYLPLGRDYKPLGLSGYNDWVSYRDFSFMLIPKDRVNIDCLRADGVFTPGFYFFDDSTYPHDKKHKLAYCDKIEKVFGIKYLATEVYR